MTRVGRVSWRSRIPSSEKSTHHRPTQHRIVKSKTSDRFVRIRHKGNLKPTQTHFIDQPTRILTSRIAKPLDRKHKLVDKNGHFNGEITTVPNPIPDTGFRALSTADSLNSSVHMIPLNRTSFPSPTAVTLLSAPVGLVTFHQGPSPATITPSSSYNESSSLTTTKSAAETRQHNLSVPIVVLVAVGSGIILIGTFVMLKCYLRPSRRPRPKPSLPILDDPFADDKRYPIDDSPIFGGKERISNGGIWSWSQYPQPEIIVTKPEDSVKSDDILRETSRGYGATAYSPRLHQGHKVHSEGGHCTPYHDGDQNPTVTMPGGSHRQASLQRAQGALSRAANRMSDASVSLYPSSPRKSQNGIGLAISHSPVTTFTADGFGILKRADSKAAASKSRHGTYTEAEKDRNTLYSEGSSYAISDAGSPSFLPYASEPATLPTRGGRSRIQSSYFASGSYPRSSQAVSKSGNSSSLDQTVPRSEPFKSKNTALSDALGLSSSAHYHSLPSPQPTLYPDDSLSVVDVKRMTKSRQDYVKKRFDKEKDDAASPVISTAMDASAAVGSLMLMSAEGKTAAPVAPMAKAVLNKSSAKETGEGSVYTNTGTTVKRSMSRSDKPPSIPLPAPLPSLAQMALEHSNPHAYADYRSPTYSIFGLYGDDRKSGV